MPVHSSSPSGYVSPNEDQRSRSILQDTLTVFQVSMQQRFTEISQQLNTISSRISDIEAKQATLEERQTTQDVHREAALKTNKRKRVTPTSLQVHN